MTRFFLVNQTIIKSHAALTERVLKRKHNMFAVIVVISGIL